MDDQRITQLRPDGLDALFEESIPTLPRLSPEAARIATGMHQAGRDAGAIAERVGASVAAVLGFLRRVTRTDVDFELESVESPQPSRSEPKPMQAAEPRLPIQEPVRGFNALTVPAMLKDCRPDVDLSKLQTATVRHLRKSGIPIATIASSFRIDTDQVLRICREIP